MRSEQWWELGVGVPESEAIKVIKRTRSRLVKDRWLRGASGCWEAYAREVWTVGGKFDGECYASTQWNSLALSWLSHKVTR